MNILELSEQEIIRRQSLEELRRMGIEPYPAAEYPTDAFSTEIVESFVDLPVIGKDEEGNDIREAATPENSRIVSIAGRMMGRRIMGKAGFAELQDSKGRIQVYVQRDAICPGEDKEMYNKVFKKLLDIGDFIGVRGYVFRTKTGEISVHAQELTLLSKSLKPLPIVKEKDGQVFDAFDDPLKLNPYTLIRRGEDGKLKRKRAAPMYPANWRDSFGLPVADHTASMQVNLDEGYAAMDTMQGESAEQMPMEMIDQETGEVCKV